MDTLTETLYGLIKDRATKIIEDFYFELNDTVTRNSINTKLTTVLKEMNELDDFVIVVDESNNTPARIDKNELWIDIAVKPVDSTQFIFIPIRVMPT